MQNSLSNEDLLNPTEPICETVLGDWRIFLNKNQPIAEIWYSQTSLPWQKEAIISCLLRSITHTNDQNYRKIVLTELLLLNHFIPNKEEISIAKRNLQNHLEMYKTTLADGTFREDSKLTSRLENNIEHIDAFLIDF